MRENYDIDVVVLWVDGSDPEWLKERAKYSGTPLELSAVRFRDWGLMRYWFRGMEKFAPWVRKIHFVTWGHLPDWLDTTNPKLHIVKHTDFIPAQYLPTFNCNPIELNLHRIEGLAERFIYFNDDMFIIRPVEPTLFFRNGLPCDCFGLDAICFEGSSIGGINGADMTILNDNFRLRKVLKTHWKKCFSPKNGLKKLIKTCTLGLFYPWFPGMFYWHLSTAFLKSTYEKVWAAAQETLDATCRCRFRQPTNVNCWAMKFWQMAEGNFVPMSSKHGKCFHLDNEMVPTACQVIRNQKKALVCVNDTPGLEDWQSANQAIMESFESILPDRCSFELPALESECTMNAELS